MFKHLLIPTDGSVLACKAIEAAIDFAREARARVTGYYALPVRESGEGDDEIDREASARYERRARHEAQLALNVIGNEARAQSVRCDLVMSVAQTPYMGIIEAASERGCDLIFMASHGRTGLPVQILGSVAQKVVALATIPVLIFRTA
ncbi:MAG: universal stress protein [Burkholderiales bacterium]